MPRLPPPHSGPADNNTKHQYYREGRRRLASAMLNHPHLLPEEALLRAQLQGGPLDPSSIYRYRADLRRILEVVLRHQKRSADFDHAWAKIDEALTARGAKIAEHEKRTSALKVTDASEDEALKLFYELKRHALLSGNMNAVLAALYVLVAAHAGPRPIELVGAQLEGTILILRNAKRQPLQTENRGLNLGELDPDVLIATKLLLSMIPHDLRLAEFRAWHKCLAEQMRRACARIGIRALSPYSFRHVAIATWSRAGLSPTEIAKMAGHLSVRTAHRHYARAKVGHKRKVVAAPAEVPPMQREGAKPAVLAAAESPRTPSASAATAISDFVFEDMLQPRSPALRASSQPIDIDELGAAKVRWAGDDDVEATAEKLRAARQRREMQQGRENSGRMS